VNCKLQFNVLINQLSHLCLIQALTERERNAWKMKAKDISDCSGIFNYGSATVFGNRFVQPDA